MKTIKYILIVVASLFVLNRCGSIHEFPDENGVDPTAVNVIVDFTADGIALDSLAFTRSAVMPRKSSCDVRYVVEVYSEDVATRGTESLVQRTVVTKAMDETTPMSIPLKLHARKYTLLFWIDCVEKGATEDMHYDTETLLAVKIKRPYTGSHDRKDAFTGMKQIDLTPYRNEWNVTVAEQVTLKRPLAKLEVVTTDIQKYIQSGGGLAQTTSMPAKVVFSYLPSVPDQYNVLNQRPEHYSNSEAFMASVTNITDSECTIAYDYLFMNGEKSNAAVAFDVYDQNDVLLNSVKSLTIPIQRNGHSVIRGEFLTKQFVGGGGAGIEDGFDGEIVIPVSE